MTADSTVSRDRVDGSLWDTRAAIVVWVTLRGWLGPIGAFQKEKITPECYVAR